MNKIKALSLFSSAGIGELLLDKDKIEVLLANELLDSRASCYEYFYPEVEMIIGDISQAVVKSSIISRTFEKDINFLIATPPCQGLSTLGKNKHSLQFMSDKRNFLILDVLRIIDERDFQYILIENVPRFLKMLFPYEKQYVCLEHILRDKYSNRYNIDIDILNAKDFGVSQSRPRAIIKMYKHGLNWDWPAKEKEITLYEAIGHLPSLNPGEYSGIKWHFAKPQSERITTAIRHTPSGKSALGNDYYYPKKKDGTRIKGFHNTYKRMLWDKPCPTRTTYCSSISSHNNAHPGKLLQDGTYSDPRVLSLLETFIVSSIPVDINFPEYVNDNFINTMIGECIPPLLMKKIIDKIFC